MTALTNTWHRITGILSGTVIESIVLFVTRVALAGIFWRSYKQKIEDGTWFTPNDFQQVLFENEFSGLPLPTDIAIPLTIYAEFLFPVLLVIGLASRFSAAALAVMAVVIQLFIFPTSAHFFGWAVTVLALALIIISRGPGIFSLDAIIARVAGQKAHG